MEMLAFEPDLPPLRASMLIGPEEEEADADWLDGINFAPLARPRAAAPSPRAAPSPPPASAPIACAPIGAGRAAHPPELVDSWESTQSLLVSSIVDETSPAFYETSLAFYETSPALCGGVYMPPSFQDYSLPRMVPVEQAPAHRPAGAALLRQQQAAQAGRRVHGSYEAAALAAAQAAAERRAAARYAGAPPPSAFADRLAAVAATQWGTCDPALHDALGTSLGAAGGYASNLPAGDYASHHHAMHASGVSQHLEECMGSGDMSEGSDTVVDRSDSQLSPYPSPAIQSSRRPPRPAGRLQLLKAPRGGRGAGEGPRPLRDAARRSMALASAAADLEEDAADDSGASVDVASADEGPSAGSQASASGGGGGDPPTKKKHNPWSLVEAEALVEGVRIVGPGKWAEIKKLPMPKLTGPLLARSAVDLKDKWRNLTRVARLPRAALKQRVAKGGSDIPLDLLLKVKGLMEAATGRD